MRDADNYYGWGEGGGWEHNILRIALPNIIKKLLQERTTMKQECLCVERITLKGLALFTVTHEHIIIVNCELRMLELPSLTTRRIK